MRETKFDLDARSDSDFGLDTGSDRGQVQVQLK